MRPDWPEALNNLGVALKSAGRFDEAILSYGRALSLQPGRADATSNTGLALHELGRANEAVFWLRRAVALQPKSAVYHNNLGTALGDSGRADRAMASFRDRRRSLPPAMLAGLAGLPGVRLVSLQKTGPAAPLPLKLIDSMAEMADFADTAALVEALDLVISVDTAVAHLAAALGKPVWLLDRFAPCWRWLTGRRDSPWYPTLRIFRQPSPGDWQSVISEVGQGLRRLAASAQ